MVAMPRVLLISRCPPWPLHLGDRLIIWHLARELAQRGYTIDLLAFTRQPEDHDEISRYRAYFGDVSLFDEPLRSPLTLLRRLLLPQTRFPRLAARASSPAMWRAIARVRRYNYDCVHFFGGIQVSEYRHAIGDLPALITPYESYSLYLKHEIAARNGLAPGSRMRHYMARRFESWMFTPFLSRVVISERDRAELRNINPALDWEVIPIGVDLEYFQPRQERVSGHTDLHRELRLRAECRSRGLAGPRTDASATPASTRRQNYGWWGTFPMLQCTLWQARTSTSADACRI